MAGSRSLSDSVNDLGLDPELLPPGFLPSVLISEIQEVLLVNTQGEINNCGVLFCFLRNENKRIGVYSINNNT